MGRTLSILLVVVGFTVIAPPAHAAVSVTLTVEQTTLSEGESAVFAGKALGARPGSVVALQRKTEAGWQTVKTRTVWSTRAYRFKTAPPRGYQKYRVLKPRQLGQASAVSPRVDLTVEWTPSIVVEASMIDESTVVVSGTATGLPDGISLRREYFDGSRWYWQSSTLPLTAEGEFSDRFPVVMGRQFRYTAVGDGPRLGASSNEFSFTELSDVSVAMNSTTGVRFPAGKSERDMRFHVDAGQTFTVHAPWSVLPLTDPSGQQMALHSEDQMFTTVAPLTGEYTITLRSDATEALWVEVTVSTPLVVRTSIDGLGQDIATNLPGQLVDLVFAADGGSLISEHHSPADGDAAGTASLADPEGAVVAHWPGPSWLGRAWRLPAASGDYAMRITPNWYDDYLVDRRDQSVLAGRETRMTVDGEAARLSLDRRGRVGEVTVTVPAGLDMRISNTGPVHVDELLIDPDGQPVDPDISQTKAGTYTTFVSYTGGPAEFDYYASTPVTYDVAMGAPADFDLGPAPSRNAIIRIPVTAGQMFSFEGVEHSTYCGTWVSVESGSELLTWHTSSSQGGHPPVFNVARSGELVLRTRSCTGAGTFRTVPSTVVQSVDTGTTTDQWGDTTTTSTATLEAKEPGQVMIMDYDAGGYPVNYVDISSAGSSFDDEVQIIVSYGDPGAGISTEVGANGGSPNTLSTRLYNQVLSTYVMFYAGPTATGTLDLGISRLDY